MEYISTFDGVFFFLTLLLAVGLTTLFVCGCLTKTPESQKYMNDTIHEYRFFIHGFWICMLFVGVANSVEGTTTFLAMCLVIGVLLAGVLRRKMQQSPLSIEMVDLTRITK